MTSVAVVLPHYGDPAPTLRLVGQLAAQADRIVVSDDCSPVPFPPTPGVEVVRRERNGGFGQAANSGVALVEEEFVLVLNSDLEVGPTFVADLMSAAAPYQPCVAGPCLLNTAGSQAESARRFPTTGQQVIEWLTPPARFRDKAWWHTAVGHDLDALASNGPVETDWLVGAALLIPTGRFRAVGGFDAKFYMNAEEVDLQRRLHDLGVPSLYVPSARATHVGGGSSDPQKRRAWLVDARWRYAEKWGGTTSLAAGLALATVANLAWNGLRRARGVAVQPLAVAAAEFRLIGSARRHSYPAPAAGQEPT